MAKWIVAMSSIILFRLVLTLQVSKFCKKRNNMVGVEELLCQNATDLLFKEPILYQNKAQNLICNNCTIQTVDSTTFNVTKTNIVILSLTSSKIQYIKELAFSMFKALRVINLRNNSISELDPKAFKNLKRIAQLDLSHNSIRILINGMFEECPNLNWLNLNHNTIYYIQPDAFKGLTSLRHLYLNNNQIKKLNGFVFKYLPNLLLLYLENNEIMEIDSFAFANLTNVNSLYLNNNSIRYLTQYNFKPLTNLADLQLRDNNLTEIQISSFNGLTNLKFLYLGNNHLKIVKRYGFVGLNNLQNLDLINNDFEIFDLGFVENMKRLNMLWLQENKISNFSIDYKMDNLNSLFSLGLNDNNLTGLNYKLLFEKLPNVKDIFIYNNTWKCELLVNMFNFFQEKNVSLCASVNCNYNRTKELVEETCSVQEEDVEKDVDLDFVSEIGSFTTVSTFLLLLSQTVFFL